MWRLDEFDSFQSLRNSKLRTETITFLHVSISIPLPRASGYAPSMLSVVYSSAEESSAELTSHNVWSTGSISLILNHFSIRLNNKLKVSLPPSWFPNLHVIVRLQISEFVYATRAIFQLSGVCHHYLWQICKFRPMLSTHGFKQWEFFYVSHLLRNGTSVYYIRYHPKDRYQRPTVHGIRTRNARIIARPPL
jgi:hypothetical protein